MHSDQHKKLLHDIAYESISHGLHTGSALKLNPTDYDTALQTRRATFVTLHKNKQLRGCIGILEPLRPLIVDVAHNAYAAAFSDHRFKPVTSDELNQLDIHISILGTPEDMTFSSEDDLISQIKPGIDGLIMEAGNNRGTFLPSVWSSINSSKEFLNHLKIKSGLTEDYWSNSIQIKRYSVEEF